MAYLKVKNNAESTLASGITAQATTLTVAPGQGERFPGDNFHITIDNEILKCTSRSGDVLTVQRAQEGTAAGAHSAGAKVQLRWTAAYVEELQTAVQQAESDIDGLQTDVAALGAVHAGPFLLVAQDGLTQEMPGPFTQVRYNLVSLDTHNAWDSQNNKWVCPVPGYYMMMVRASLQSLPDGKRIAVSIFVNNIENNGGRVYDSVVGGLTNVAGSGATFNHLDQGDQVMVKLFHSNDGSLYTVGQPKTDALMIVRVA